MSNYELYVDFEDMDKLFMSANKDKLIMLKGIAFDDDAALNVIKSNMRQELEGDTISVIPTCVCGAYNTQYLEGKECDKCNTVCQSYYANYEPILWLEQLEGVGGFLNPYYATILETVLPLKRSLILWFSDRRYNPPYATLKEQNIFREIERLDGFERSYSFFVNNIDKLISIILSIASITDKARIKDILLIQTTYRENKDKLISKYLPLMNKMFITLEKTNKGKYILPSLSKVQDIVYNYIKYNDSDSLIMREKITGKIVQLTVDLLKSTIGSFLSSKKGLVRKQIFGMRSHFSFRSVITPITTKHKHNEVHIPWIIAIVVLRPMIINRLSKMGLSSKVINMMMYSALKSYDDDIYQIITSLIKEADGIGATLQRNPSQNSGSILLVKIMKVKHDVSDNTISAATHALVYGNADYDGDEVNMALILDHYLFDLLVNLEPRYPATAVTANPLNVFGKVGLPETAVSGIANRINYENGVYNG